MASSAPPHPPCITVPLFPFLLPREEMPAPSAQLSPALSLGAVGQQQSWAVISALVG